MGLVVVASTGVAAGIWLYGQNKIAALSREPDRRFAAANSHLLASRQQVSWVIIGDSRVARWAPAPEGVGNVVLRGVGGETTAQARARLVEDAIALRPRAILVLAGINDLVAASYMAAERRSKVVDEAMTRLREMAKQIAAAGQCAKIATVLPPARPGPLRRLVWRPQVVADVAALNERLRAMRSSAFHVLDLAGALPVDAEGYLLTNHSEDALHVNAAAYALLNQVLSAATLPPDCRQS